MAQDLAGIGDTKERGDFFRKLFVDLNMPAGSHALWPLQVSPEKQVDPLFFLSGVTALAPDTIVFMAHDDDPNFKVMNFPRVRPLVAGMWRGFRFIRLHGVDELHQYTAPRREKLMSLIRTLHRPSA